MAGWSLSDLLHSLGWATLNSFWQMALIWGIYWCADQLFSFTSTKKYTISLVALITGFSWFLVTFFLYFNSNRFVEITVFKAKLIHTDYLFNTLLYSASITYLLLLFIPSYNLVKNYFFVRKIKYNGIRKAEVSYRLFVQNLAAKLGINQKVTVFISELVDSPLTVGFLKPVILIPVAALNNLSMSQVEAVLLHELSHIKRYDYLINIIAQVISTLLYFNPFIKKFLNILETEREHCCDEMVIRFGYDKVGYASALLKLEKLSAGTGTLVLGATGKNYLLRRIENIVGMEKKRKVKRNDLAGLLIAAICVILFNSVVVIKENKAVNQFSLAYNEATSPFYTFPKRESISENLPNFEKSVQKISKTYNSSPNVPAIVDMYKSKNTLHKIDDIQTFKVITSASLPLLQIGYDEIDGALSNEEKEKVKTTVAETKTVLGNLEWNQVENNIADAMDETEKAQAKKYYLKELEKNINWKNVESNLKAKYNQVNWPTVDANLSKALNVIHLDSIQRTYSLVLNLLNKADSDVMKSTATPFPDESIGEIQKAKACLNDQIKTIKSLRLQKKVVRL